MTPYEAYIKAMQKRRAKQLAFCQQYLRCRSIEHIEEDFSSLTIEGEVLSIERFKGMCRAVQLGNIKEEDVEFR